MNKYFIFRKLCPACKSNVFNQIYTCKFIEPPICDYLKWFYIPQGKIEFEYLINTNFTLCECVQCGLIFQQEIPNKILMKKIYEEWIDHSKVKQIKINKKNRLSHFIRIAQEIMSIIKYFDISTNKIHLFDFGMGRGDWCRMSQAFGCKTYGFDLSEEHNENAKAYGITIINWNEISQNKFDFINTEQVFEHISEPYETLEHLSKSLKQNGIIKINVPDCKDLKSKLKKCNWKTPKSSRYSLNPVAPLEHINCFNRLSLIKMASKSNLQLVKIPLKIQYRYLTNWSDLIATLRNISRPIKKDILNRGTYLLFSKNSTV